MRPKLRTHVACNSYAIDLRLDVRNGCDGFQHAEYFTCGPLITQPIFIRFSNGFHRFSLHSISFPMIAAHTT